MNSGKNFRFAASVAVRSTLLSSLSSPLSAGCTKPRPPVISSVISPPPGSRSERSSSPKGPRVGCPPASASPCPRSPAATATARPRPSRSRQTAEAQLELLGVILRQCLLRDQRVRLAVPQIPRRRANQLGNLVRVLKLGAIHPDHCPRVPEQNLRRGFHNARLPRPGRPQKQQVAHWTSLRAHPRQEDLVEVHQSANAFLLTDDLMAQRGVELLRFNAASAGIQLSASFGLPDVSLLRRPIFRKR